MIHIEKTVQSEKESVAAMKQLIDDGVDYILILVGSWMYVNVVATPARKFKKPFALWAFPDMEAAGLILGKCYSGRIRRNWCRRI